MSMLYQPSGSMDEQAFYGPTAAKQQRLDTHCMQSTWMGPLGNYHQPGRSNSRDSPGFWSIPPQRPELQPNNLNDHWAQRKRQYTDGDRDPCAGSSQSAFGESQMLYGPTGAKQQKLEEQSSMMRSQAKGDPRGQRFQGGQPSVRHNMGSFNKPGHWGGCPQQPPAATAQPVRPPYPPPLQTVNGWLPPDRPVVQPDGRSSTDDPKPAADVLPEMPAEQEIDRLRAELSALEKDYYISMSSENVSSHFNREKYTQEFRNKRKMLQDKMKKETERQRIENLQLSQQFAQQYNVSLGSNPCETSTTEVVNSDNHSQNKTENEEKEALTVVSDEVEKLTCQRSVVDSKIETLMSQDCLTEEEQRRLGCLRQQLRALDRKLGLVSEKRDKLLKQSVKKIDTGPFHVLGKLAKKMQGWREYKHSELTAAQDQLCGNNMGSSNTLKGIGSKPDEEEVIVISDEDDDVEITGHTGMNSRNTHQQKQSCERRHHRAPKSVRVINKCVTKSGMASTADESYFLLSGLAGILLERQQRRRQTQTLPTDSSAAEQPSAVSQLIREMTSKLNLVEKQRRKGKSLQKPHKKQEQEKTVNLYMKIYNEQS